MNKSIEDKVRNLDPNVGTMALLMAISSAEELEIKNGLMMPKKEYIASKSIVFAAQIQEADQALKHRMEAGYSLLIEKTKMLPEKTKDKYIQEFRNAGQKILTLLDQNIGVEAKAEEFFPCNNFQDVLGFSSEMMEWAYQVGVHLFQEKRISEANSVFYVLMYLNNMKPNYWIASALSEKALHNYPAALMLFNVVSLFEPENPSVRYNCAEIYLELGQADEALRELQALAMIIENTKREDLKVHHNALHERAVRK